LTPESILVLLPPNLRSKPRANGLLMSRNAVSAEKLPDAAPPGVGELAFKAVRNAVNVIAEIGVNLADCQI